MMGSDRWQRPSRSSRLRGDDLDRRIVNIDPERILREQRAQHRLQNQLQVPDDLHACLERSVGTLACGQLPMPNRCSLTDLWMQHISAQIGSDPMQAEDKPGFVHIYRQGRGKQHQPSSPMVWEQSATQQQMAPWQALMLQHMALTVVLT